MADKRMFAKTIIDSDAFLEMPVTTQLLYFHLSMRADDDGFVNKPKSIMRMVGAKEDDLTILFAKKFVIPFESGIVVIKHWKIHNYIRKDCYHETKYRDEKALLELDENDAYRFKSDMEIIGCDESVTSSSRNCDNPLTQVSIDKVSIDKVSKEKKSIDNVSTNVDTSVEKDSKKDSEEIVNALRVMQVWNDMAFRNGLPQVTKLTDTRKKAVNARLKEYSEEEIIADINSFDTSPLLIGKKTDWKADFDWFVKKANFLKVHEGNYINRQGGTQKGRLDWIDNIDFSDVTE